MGGAPCVAVAPCWGQVDGAIGAVWRDIVVLACAKWAWLDRGAMVANSGPDALSARQQQTSQVRGLCVATAFAST